MTLTMLQHTEDDTISSFVENLNRCTVKLLFAMDGTTSMGKVLLKDSH